MPGGTLFAADGVGHGAREPRPGFVDTVVAREATRVGATPATMRGSAPRTKKVASFDHDGTEFLPCKGQRGGRVWEGTAMGQACRRPGAWRHGGNDPGYKGRRDRSSPIDCCCALRWQIESSYAEGTLNAGTVCESAGQHALANARRPTTGQQR